MIIILPIIIFILSIYAVPTANSQVKAPQIPPKVEDNRIVRIRHFLESKNSPLASASADFVIFGDQYKIAPEILVGISKSESNFEKAGDTTDNNPFGFRCTGTLPCLRFRDYRTAVWHLAKTLGTKPAYKRFRETGKVEDIATNYLSGDKARWSRTVSSVREELK